MPQIKSYPKAHLRALLYNPNLDCDNVEALSKAQKMDKRTFAKKVQPVIDRHCKKFLSVEEFNNLKIVPTKAVEVIFKHLL